jgi:hypothetical protein
MTSVRLNPPFSGQTLHLGLPSGLAPFSNATSSSVKLHTGGHDLCTVFSCTLLTAVTGLSAVCVSTRFLSQLKGASSVANHPIVSEVHVCVPILAHFLCSMCRICDKMTIASDFASTLLANDKDTKS